jgi:putrescine transport system substrate-binding protein
MSMPRLLLALLLLLSALVPSPGRAAEEEKFLNVYNWADYIAEDTIKNFEKETGIKVRYDNFDNIEILHAKLVAGKSGYDIVVPGLHWIKLQVEAGLLMKLDKSRIPNLKYLEPLPGPLTELSRLHDDYLVDWLWGYTTVGINVDKVKAALGNLPLPDNAWDLIFKPEYISRLKSCGVSMLDSPSDIVPAALHYLGRPAYSANPADYTAAAALLRSIRPHVAYFSTSAYINDLAAGTICASLGFSGDINIARQRAIDSRSGSRIEALIPKTGGLMFFDMMAIPADAPHPGNALKWMNYILRPDVHASLTNRVHYPNRNREAQRYVRPDILANPSVYLSDAEQRRMVMPTPLTNEMRRYITRTYTAFKTGL